MNRLVNSFISSTDPDEIDDLWDDPEYVERKRALLDTLREWRIRSQYRTKEWGATWR